MSRPRNFCTDQVLDRALALFWSKGYAATSVRDLVAATGINRASMYATFGDKQQLFIAAVDRYITRFSQVRLAVLTAPDAGRQAIVDYFQGLLAFSTGEGRRWGCLLTNSAVEFAGGDPLVGERLLGSFQRLEDALAAAIARGQAQGDIDPTKDPRALACHLLCTVQGLRVLARAGAPDATLQGAVTVALEALG